MRLSVFLWWLCAAVLSQATTTPGSERAPLTEKELAQGYREHVILARPRADRKARAESREAREGLRVREKIRRMGDLRIIDLDPSDNAQAAISRLKATGDYDYIEPDSLRHIAALPNDPSFTDGSLWGLRNNGATNNGVAGADISAVSGWDITREAPNVIVAVVDTGVNLTHQDLTANLWTNPSPTFGDLHGASFVNGGTSGAPVDDNGHGTHVAGTIGASGDNNLATTGVAWRVKIMAIKVFPSSGTGLLSDVVKGINYAVEHGAHIINASYGEAGGFGFSQIERDAMAAAREAGVIVVAAAGNSGANMEVTRFYPASHALDNIVSVGASTRRDELALFSNYGAPVDLFAPGAEIVSLDYASTTGVRTLSGTSMAAPHVAGVLALLKARFPSDNYRQLINRLLRGVDPGPRFTGKAQTGGRLNLLKALQTPEGVNGSRPFNDDFPNRSRLTGSNFSLRSSNAGATAEPGETAHAGVPATNTLWWEWTAPSDANIKLDTFGSGYDTVLAVYTGSSATSLTRVAANDDTVRDDLRATVESRVTFSATSGVTYQIAVDGKFGQTGLTLLNMSATPANDSFAGAAALSGASTHVAANNGNCSREPDEPHILGWPGGRSMWYRWVAPRSDRFQISVTSSDFDPLLGVFTGVALGSLKYEAESTGTIQNGPICTLTATAGTSYYIYVDTKAASATGQFTLSLTDSQWQAAVSGPITSSPAVAPDGTIYFGSSDRSLYAYSPDGTRKWSALTAGLIDTCSPAVADDGTVYVGSNDGWLYAFSPAGTRKWFHDFGRLAPTSNSPALAPDGTIYIKAGDGFLYALNPADGTTKWRYDVGAAVTYGSPSIAPDGTIYQGSDDKKLYALNPDGTLKWTYTADGDVYTVPAIDAAGNIYFSVLNTGKFYSLSPAGALRWVYSGAALGSSSSAALSADGSTAYFAGYDGKLHAVITSSGVARWVYTLGGEVRASSPAIDSAGVIYVGCYDYKLYAVNADGTLKRTYDTGNWIRSSPVISGGNLYVGSNDGKLYSFAIGTESAAGPWPQYKHNPRRVGRALTAATITTQPVSRTINAGDTVSFVAAASGAPSPSFQWQLNGSNLAGETSATLAVTNVQPVNAGIYTAVVSSGAPLSTTPAILGVITNAKVLGQGTELRANIVHGNGNVYDQVLLQGRAASITADAREITRMSYVDLNGDIVQVEFSGAGTLSLVLEGSSGPLPPAKYNQPDVSYMSGHAGIVISGADETTNISIFSVGTLTATNPALFRTDVTYDGVVDLAYIAILSRNGKFGGVKTGNVSYWNTRGMTGILAPGVQFTGPVYLGDINAKANATPVLLLGTASDVRITGGSLKQDNNRAVQISGVAQLRFEAGVTSHNVAMPAQTNRARLESNGINVTNDIVVNPGAR